MTICPTCTFAGAMPVVQARDPFQIRHCPVCDIVFADPMKNPGPDWYESHDFYHELQEGPERLPKLFWYHRKFLHEPVPPGGALLEIGCGSGILLAAARRRGWRVTGLDFSDVFIKIARTHYGLEDLHRGTLEEFMRRNPERRFDGVAFFEVLEHLDDPLDHMRRVRAALKPGGRVYLSTPNRHRFLDSIGFGDDPPHHLTRWSPRANRRFIRRSGFALEELYLKPLDLDDVVRTISLRTDASARVLRVAARPDEIPDPGKRVRREVLKRSLVMAGKAVMAAFVPARLAGSGLYCRARTS